MFREISDSFVISTVQNYAAYSNANQDEVRRLYSMLAQQLSREHEEDIIKALSLAHLNINDMLVESNEFKDISNVYEHFHEIYMQELKNTRKRICHVWEMQDSMNRIMACYKSLSPTLEYLTLQYLYERYKTYSKGLKMAKKELGLSESSLKRYRKEGVDRIIELYKSELSNQDMLLSVADLGEVTYK